MTKGLRRRVLLDIVPGRNEFNECIRKAGDRSHKGDVRPLRNYVKTNGLDRDEAIALVNFVHNLQQEWKRGHRKGPPRFDPLIHAAARAAWNRIEGANLNIEQGSEIIQEECDKLGKGGFKYTEKVRRLLKRHKTFGDRIKVSSAS
jgi:hypothetical protein